MSTPQIEPCIAKHKVGYIDNTLATLIECSKTFSLIAPTVLCLLTHMTIKITRNDGVVANSTFQVFLFSGSQKVSFSASDGPICFVYARKR